MKTESVCCAVALFVKPPIPGRVKTRLAKDIGAEAACRIYCSIAEQTVRKVRESNLPLVLFYDGHDESALPELWRNEAAFCFPQRGKDLGARMAEAFRSLFSEGIERVLLVGSDIPGLDSAYLKKAAKALKHYKIVIGPALDGGYCLIGLNSMDFDESIFAGIPWSTKEVLELTIAKCRVVGLTPFLLEPLRDIDNVKDLLEEASQLL